MNPLAVSRSSAVAAATLGFLAAFPAGAAVERFKDDLQNRRAGSAFPVETGAVAIGTDLERVSVEDAGSFLSPGRRYGKVAAE